MASMTGWPTDADEGSVANEARWRSMARLWAPSGVVAGYLGELAPTLAAGPIINVAAGAAWIDGHYTELASPASESATAAGLLVVRFTSASNLFELVYRDGASGPTQTEAVWELPIASMTSGALTDLRKATTLPITGTAVGFSASNASAQSVASDTVYSYYVPASVSWQSTEWTRTTQWVTTRGGIYFVNAQVGWAASATGRRGVVVSKNLETAGFILQTQIGTGDGPQTFNASGLLRLDPGNGLRLGVVQNSGGALQLNNARLEAHWIGQRIG